MGMKNHTSMKTIALIGLLASAAVAWANIPPVAVAGTIGGVAHGLGGAFSTSGAAGPGAIGGFGGVGAGSASNIGGGFEVGAARGGRVDAFESIGMRQARLTRESTPPAANPLTDTVLESSVSLVPNEHAASTMLSTGFSAETIRVSRIEERQQLAADISKRLDATKDAMATLKTDAKVLEGDAKADFKAAAKEVRACEKELKAKVKSARKAPADAWSENRAKLAASYEAYMQSVTRAESLVAAESGEHSAGAGTTATRSAAN